jgi:squalene synthase HpnC
MTVETRPRLPGAAEVMARAGGENFTVASRVLPRAVRADLLALYGYARLVDETGDAVAGDRLAALDWLEADLDRAYAGRAEHPVLQRLSPVLRKRRLPREPLAALIEANRRDQRVSRYETFEDLLGYCELSANPVGRLVLCVLDAATPERVALSDAVCTGLQLAEHWQDVAEDLAGGRLYVPLEDLRRFGCAERDLATPPATPQVRELMAFEVSRARELLDRGAPLARMLHGRARWAVAGFVGGGRAALDAIARADYDVLAGAPRAGAGRRALAVVRAIAETRR